MNEHLKNFGSGITYFCGIYYNNKWFTRHNEFGTVSKNSKILINDQTRFDIASLTKTFTAILIHKAVEEKKFAFNDKISEIDSKFQKIKNITIEDLLCHRVEIWTDGYLGNVNSEKEYSHILNSAYIKSTFPKYTDTHYIILSRILEKVYQKKFNLLIQEKITEPLNLKNTSYFVSSKENVASCDCEKRENEIIKVPKKKVHDQKARSLINISVFPGHAGLFSTASDIFQVLKTLIDDSETILSKNSLNHFFAHDDYNDYLKLCKEKNIGNTISPYTYGGMRYKIKIEEYNPVRVQCSLDSYLFSGYTGPIYLIDKKNKIIIVVMINSVHQSTKTRQERLNTGIDLINELYLEIKKEFFM